MQIRVVSSPSEWPKEAERLQDRQETQAQMLSLRVRPGTHVWQERAFSIAFDVLMYLLFSGMKLLLAICREYLPALKLGSPC